MSGDCDEYTTDGESGVTTGQDALLGSGVGRISVPREFGLEF
jgi:hypothetical protein